MASGRVEDPAMPLISAENMSDSQIHRSTSTPASRDASRFAPIAYRWRPGGVWSKEPSAGQHEDQRPDDNDPKAAEREQGYVAPCHEGRRGRLAARRRRAAGHLS
jgi:hypothetical protein